VDLTGTLSFPDTRHRMVTYTAAATSRFVEYFAQTRVVTLASTAVVVDAAGIVDGTDVVRLTASATEGAATLIRGVDYTVDPTDGTVTGVSPIALGAQVAVTYVAPPVSRLSTEAGTPTTVNVKSTARPAAPAVRYVVPTFSWSSSSSARGVTSTRVGGGLRVYLERPWWSSGQDEQLAVICPNGFPGSRAYDLGGLTTRWGADPVWGASPVSVVVSSADFPLATGTVEQLTPAEGGSVEAALHQVAYDETRGLWYADIQVKPGGGYMPFVRLGLARYQASSLPDLELSPIAVADFMQLSPDRSASVTFGSDPTTVNVAVTAPTVVEGLAIGARTAVACAVETTQQPEPTELDWTPVAPASPLAVDGELYLDQSYAAGSYGTSTGQVTLPAARGQQQMRLVIHEYELYPVDPTDRSLQIDWLKGRRLIYTDVIPL
jgi:hypothetical protein